MKVLVVDDDATARTVLKLFLKSHPACEIVEAGDGIEALEVLEREAPAMAFLDLGLPGMDGIAVLEWLRRHPVHAAPPIVILSGVGDLHTVLRTIALGIADYLVKPLHPQTVENRLLPLLRAITAGEGEAAAPSLGRGGAG